jgi:hypothetical protein
MKRNWGIQISGADGDRRSWGITHDQFQAKEKKKLSHRASAACGGSLRRGIRWMTIKGRKEG